MQLPGQKQWTQGTCTGTQGPRSFGVKVGETEYHRNRRQLLRKKEVPLPEVPDQESPRQVEVTAGIPRETPSDDRELNQHLTPPSTAPEPGMTNLFIDPSDSASHQTG